MRSKFEPKNLQRAKETLHKQLEVVKEMKKGSPAKPEKEKETHLPFSQRIKRFLQRFI